MDFEKIEKEQLLPIDGGQLSFGDINHDRSLSKLLSPYDKSEAKRS